MVLPFLNVSTQPCRKRRIPRSGLQEEEPPIWTRCGCEDPELVKVTLERESLARVIGARVVDTETREVGLMVVRISEGGVLSEWNARNPSAFVAPGDSIVELNGLTKPWEIMEEMGKATTLEMVVRRATPGSGALLARCEITDRSLQTTALLLQRTVRACDVSVDSCAICLEDVEVDDRIAGLECGHGFHQRCIMKWLTSPGAFGCPLCRGDVH
jgi:hypothetical protein